MGAWIIARGRGAESTLTEGAGAGTRTLALAGADETHAPGDLLFISAPDGGGVEYLGTVTEVDAAGLTTAFALRADMPPDSFVWSPAARLGFFADAEPPPRIQIDPGFTLLRTLGGARLAVRTRAAVELLDLGLAGLTPAEAAAIETWLSDMTGAGLLPFTLVGGAREVTAVRRTSAPATRMDHPGGSVALRLPLEVLGRARYE